ncbi:MAG: tetraacyldisaccharide 4'-kinase [Cyclobacteriaceae bacterium]|nr:tetraacyldisaccharide 4'-kinase [Cyclobacteriaceae bacterium]
MRIGELILFPFSFLYGTIMWGRNFLYDKGIRKSVRFEVNVISVGNLAVGGTGKTPVVEYLTRLLAGDHQTAILSRGYRRKTKGFRLAGEEDNARTIGDEPFQYYRKFSDQVEVAVGEHREVAIPFILAERPDIKVIILDDAFQHRVVNPSFSIMLTRFDRLFYRDYVLPSGRLREGRQGAKRADVIVVTHCPESMEGKKMDEISLAIARYSSASVFFACLKYDNPVPVYGDAIWNNHVILVSGIAHADQLENYVAGRWDLLTHVNYADHFSYPLTAIRKIKSLAEKKDCVILTTEKDAAKWVSEEIAHELSELPVFYLPVRFVFLERGTEFDGKIRNSLKEYAND